MKENIQAVEKVSAPETRKWKDSPRSTAEQIEISLRTGNLDKAKRIDAVVQNCNFAIANSDNAELREFASIISRIAKGD